MCRYVALALLLGWVPAFAQFSGRLSGSVLDSSSAPVPNAAVNLYLAGGTKPLLSTRTAPDGTYKFIGVRPTDYDLAVEAPGFARSSLRAITVDPARETDLPAITLQLSTISQSLAVTADAQSVETGNAEISDTIDVQQIQKLPVLDRDPLALVQTLPGVVYQGNSPTTINGLRTSFSNMTLDGINIQDNYLRDNALDYTPNRVLLGQIRGFTLSLPTKMQLLPAERPNSRSRLPRVPTPFTAKPSGTTATTTLPPMTGSIISRVSPCLA